MKIPSTKLYCSTCALISDYFLSFFGHLDHLTLEIYFSDDKEMINATNWSDFA